MRGMANEPRDISARQKRAILIAAGVAVIGAMGGAQSLAASATWTGAGGNWEDSTNWSAAYPGTTASGTINNTDVATFTTGGTTSVTLDNAPLNVKSITFGASGVLPSAYTIGTTGGNSLLLTSGGAIGFASGTSAGTTAETINAPIVLEGATATTAGSYTFGSTASNGNLLNFGGAISTGTTGLVTLTLTGQNTVGMAAGTISGQISGNLALTHVSSNASVWTIGNSNNSFTGPTAIQSGSLIVSVLKNVGAGNSSLGAPTTVANGTIGLGVKSSSGILSYQGSGNSTTDRVISIQGDNANTIDSSGTGTITFTSDAAIGTVAAGTSNNTAKTLTLTGTNIGDNTFSGKINNGTDSAAVISIIKSGAGTWVLSGANGFTGTVNLNAGTLGIGNDSALGSTNTVTVGNNTGLEARGADRSITQLNSGGTLRIGGGHNLTVAGTLNLTNSATFNVDLGSTFTVTPAFGISNVTTNHSLTLGGAGNTVINGEIGNGGGSAASTLAKNGTGTVTFNVANTYAGTTTISDGLLLANNSTGSATGTGSINVSTGKLGGNGHIAPTGAASITLSSGARLSPGDAGAGSLGSLELNFAGSTGSLNMNTSSGFEFNLGTAAGSLATAAAGSTGDRLLANGFAAGKFALNASGNTVDFMSTGSNGFYKIIDTNVAAATTSTDIYNNLTYATTGPTAYQITAGLNAANVPSGGTATFFIGSGLAGGGDAGDIYVQLSNVPEPASLALIGLGAVGLLRRKRSSEK